MKKTYINPEMEIIKIQTQKMIATSGLAVDGTTEDTNDLLGRGFGSDIDDEDE